MLLLLLVWVQERRSEAEVQHEGAEREPTGSRWAEAETEVPTEAVAAAVAEEAVATERPGTPPFYSDLAWVAQRCRETVGEARRWVSAQRPARPSTELVQEPVLRQERVQAERQVRALSAEASEGGPLLARGESRDRS